MFTAIVSPFFSPPEIPNLSPAIMTPTAPFAAYDVEFVVEVLPFVVTAPFMVVVLRALEKTMPHARRPDPQNQPLCALRPVAFLRELRP